MPGSATFFIQTVFKGIDRLTAPVSRMQARVLRFTRSMTNGLKRIDRATSALARGLGQGIKRGAMVATGAILTVGAALNKVAGDIDTLAKLTRNIEFPIEAFQEWRFVGEQAGVKQETFNKSLGKFTKTLGEAKGGYGAMFTALKKGNKPLLKQLKNTKDVSKAFEIYMKAIEKVDDPMKRAALASAAFGRAGLDMVGIAKLGSKEIEKLRKEQRQNGVVTQKQAEAAEAFNDSINSLTKAGTGLLQDVFTPMMPLLTKGAKFAREWAIENKGLVSSKLLEFGRKVVANWDKIVSVAKEVAKGVAFFFALAGAVKVLIGVMSVLNVVMAANPIGLIAIAILAAIAAIAAAYIWAEKLKAVFEDLPTPVKALVAVLIPLMGPIVWLMAAAVILKTQWSKISPFMVALGKAISSAWTTSMDAIQGAWDKFVPFFTDLWNATIGVFESAVNAIITTGPISWLIAGVILIKNHWGEITSFFSAVWEGVTNIFMAAVGYLLNNGPISWIISAVMLVVDNWSAIVGLFSSIWSAVVGVFDIAMASLREGPLGWLFTVGPEVEEAFSPLTGFFASLWSGIVGIFQSAVDKIKGIVSPVVDFVKGIIAAKDKLVSDEIGKVTLGGRIDVKTPELPKAPPGPKPPEPPPEPLPPNVLDLEKFRLKRSPVAKGDEEQEGQRARSFNPIISSPQERTARSIEERHSEERSEVVIRDETGRAEVAQGKLGKGVKLKKTGSF